MKLGFLGTGAISEAVIRGLLTCGGLNRPVLVSRRNENRSNRLADEFSLVQIVDDNQKIVDESSIVFIAVLPEQVRDLLSKLQFREEHIVANFAAGITNEELLQFVAPATRVHRLIPMPPIEYGLGPIPIHPPCPTLAQLFGPVGSIIDIEDERYFEVLTAGSSVMGIYFEMIAVLSRWINRRGLPNDAAAIYATSLMQSLSKVAAECDADGLQELSKDCLTPGGLNEQVLNESHDCNWFAELETRLENIAARIERQNICSTCPVNEPENDKL